MIRLIIVDDEETTRDSLAELVPWNELGIDAVKTAQNGLDALSLAEEFTPSVMLCDVRMPKMDGIELAKRIRQLYPDCEILFLSGYSDKEYLKSAIQVSAVDYLEKPVDIDTLKSIFGNVVQKIKDNKLKASEDERLKSSLNENIHILRQEVVLELLSGKADLSNLSIKYGPKVFEFSGLNIFTLGTAKFNWISQIGEDDKLILRNKILKTLNSEEIFGKFKVLCGFTNDSYLVLITDREIYSESSEYCALLNNIVSLLTHEFKGYFTVSIGYGTPVKSPVFFPECYKSTLETLKMQFYQGTNKVFHPLKAIQSSYQIDKGIYTKFKKLLRSNSIGDIKVVVENLTRDISNNPDSDIYKIKNIYFNLVRILLEVTMKWDSFAPGEDSENKYIWQEIDSQLTLQGLSEFLLSCIETIYKKSDDKDASIKKINEIQKYILDNYTDNQMSIQTISEHTFLSQTYLCAFFKKSTGKTLNEYITELRIEKAKELLKDSRIKLYEITSNIGFTDSNYFSTLFKRYTGFTPSEFREKNIYDKKNI